MKSAPAKPREFDFCFPGLDTLVRVEVMDDCVIIRATRDTFSSQRKAFFVRELAAEGFIPDEYQWFSSVGAYTPYRAASWQVDYSWLTLNAETIARARRFAIRLFTFNALLLALLMGLVLTGHLGDGRAGPVGRRDGIAVFAHAILGPGAGPRNAQPPRP